MLVELSTLITCKLSGYRHEQTIGSVSYRVYVGLELIPWVNKWYKNVITWARVENPLVFSFQCDNCIGYVMLIVQGDDSAQALHTESGCV